MAIEADLLERLTVLLGRRDLTQTQMSDWFGGAADGGPYGDGIFPLTDSAGYTRKLPSPARIAEALLQPAGVEIPTDPPAVIVDHGRKLGHWSFSVPPVSVAGRPLQPTALSFDLQVVTGIWLDTGAPYDPLAPDVAPAITLARTLLVLEPMVVGGRLLQPSALSYDLQVMAGTWLDTGQPFDPLAPDPTPAIAVARGFIMPPPISVAGRQLVPTALSFDLQVIAGFWLDDGSPFGAIGGGSGLSRMRIVPVSATLAYLITPRPQGGGYLAHRFQRRIGGTSGADTGPPYDVWRRTGTALVPSFEDSPAAAFTGSPAAGQIAYNLDAGFGAVDYAILSGGEFIWAGSYHGGETLLFYSGPDFTQPQRMDTLSLRHVSRVAYASGKTFDVDYRLSIDADGVLREDMRIAGTMSASKAMLGMEMGSVTPRTTSGYSQITYDGVSATVDPNGTAQLSLGAARDVTMRNPDTGLTIRCISDAPFSYVGGGETYIQTAGRTKLYYQRGAGPLGRIDCSRTILFGQQ